MTDEMNFEPLTDAERESIAAETLDVGAIDAVAPVKPPHDAEPAEAAALRLFARKPDMFWLYRDGDGSPLFGVARWNMDDGKKVMPVSYLDSEGWQFKHWPAPRPLYRLDALTADKSAAVVVCEGEKAADAAARIFPKSVATTASGGANAIRKSDWTPLAGRRVLLWPDNDEAGAGWTRAVADTLAKLDCDVSIIDVAALVKQLQSSDPKGHDAADALAEMPDVAALRKLTASLAKPFDAGPAFVSFGAFTMDATGLHVETEEGRGENKQTVTHWVSAPFEIVGACRDLSGGTWGKVLRWRDPDEREHVRHVADAALQGEPAALCSQLAEFGLRISRSRQRALLDYIASARVRHRVRLVNRTGWHEIDGRAVFVLPHETIGPSGGERVILDAAAHGPYEARGTVDDWRNAVAHLASGHVLPVLAISTALAGPLLYLLAVEGGGVHFYGRSSAGKTTLLQMAGSVWGRGEPGGFVRSWRATANGLEGAAAGASDTALILDELGQVDARELGAAAYALANGSGKARAARDGALREPKSWRVLTISSGELPAASKLEEDRSRVTRAGQRVRLLDVATQRLHGVFDHPGPDGDAGKLAKACKLAAATSYGTAGPAFVRRLVSDNVTGETLRQLVADFTGEHVPKGADGQVDRAAQRFGMIAAAGELATQFGLTGWREGEAWDAAAWAVAQWIEHRGGTEPAEVSQAIAQVRRFIEAHGESRFDALDVADAKPVTNCAGWREGSGQERRWYVPTETWKHEICAGLDADFVARVLAERNMLGRGGDGLQAVKKIRGRPTRVRVVTPAILDGGEL